MPRLTPPLTTQLDDPKAERVRRNHEQRIAEITVLPAVSLTVIGNVVIPDSSDVVVAHPLGRPPTAVLVSPPRGANTVGMVREFRHTNPLSGAPIDPAKVICLRADGFGASITVDVTVF